MNTVRYLVIPGFPKCGTTSLHGWLVAHPEILGAKVKEPSYLMDKDYPFRDGLRNYVRQGMPGYRQCWDTERIAAPIRLLLDASTHYIFQNTALRALSQQTPLPYVIVVLRKPEDRVYSAFRFAKYTRETIDPNLSFSEYVQYARLRDETAFRGRIKGTAAYIFARQLDRSHYVKYLRPWASSFGENFKVLVLENFTANPALHMRELATYLNIDPEFYRNFQFNILNVTKPRKKSIILGMFDRFFAHDEQLARHSKDDDRVLLELKEDYKESNEKLAAEFGIDLSTWS
ncbi:sulfotransferase domain-containing protein [Desulfofustis glycolicus]|uniref:Sulfotransferase family protein n=1 Tax=Desulfofustis glycolicus DSM 9705 TaxID=1121409 RepID=A0A1M5WHT5_9BACT|nr:sulfotransferase domain-containing protein [Desulfofustis glycolicus]MCB2216846.1 sulfotransferase [Desulfobulbaceae bacterium]SHH87080.1 Sulfotransferase family protein [Desulfofustis glycolicus DSM 9705]